MVSQRTKQFQFSKYKNNYITKEVGITEKPTMLLASQLYLYGDNLTENTFDPAGAIQIHIGLTINEALYTDRRYSLIELY